MTGLQFYYMGAAHFLALSSRKLGAGGGGLEWHIAMMCKYDKKKVGC